MTPRLPARSARVARRAGGGHGSLGPLEPQLSPGGYGEAFAALQDAIHAGDIYQANLTFPLAGSYRGDPVALYAALRGAAAAGYGGLVFDGSHWLLSLSPELFFSPRRGGQGQADEGHPAARPKLPPTPPWQRNWPHRPRTRPRT